MKIIFVIVYCAGLVALMGWAIFAWTKYQKRKLPEFVENLLGFLLFIIILGGGFWIMNITQKDIIEDYKKTQHTFCLNSTTKDGAELTEVQCEYFQKVLNGEYSTLEGDYSDNYSY